MGGFRADGATVAHLDGIEGVEGSNPFRSTLLLLAFEIIYILAL